MQKAHGRDNVRRAGVFATAGETDLPTGCQAYLEHQLAEARLCLLTHQGYDLDVLAWDLEVQETHLRTDPRERRGGVVCVL